jgi:hypothetical protein
VSVVRAGSINETGVVTASRFGANGPFNLSLEGFGTATVKLERRFPGDGEDTDRRLSEEGDVRVSEAGATRVSEGSIDGGFRPMASYTADQELVVTPAGPTEYQLNCTAFTSGPIEFRLG